MNIAIKKENLPANAKELNKFILFGTAKADVVKAEIRTMKKLNVGASVLNDKLNEGYQVSAIVLYAKAKMGELILEMPKTQEIITEGCTNTTLGSKSLLPEGIDKHKSHRFQQITKNPEIVEQILAEARKKLDMGTEWAVLKIVKAQNREADIQKQKDDIEEENIENPKGKFDVVVVDPPWPYGRKYDSDNGRVANPYPEMDIEQITDLKIPGKSNSVLWLWTTHKFLQSAFQIMEAWNFQYKATMVWNKEEMGIGSWLRMQCEFCLLGIKGDPVFEGSSTRDIINEPRREHSRKPQGFYDMVEKVCFGKKLDYFSREKRKGWIDYGNDNDKF